MAEEFKPIIDFAEVHRTAAAHARDAYFEKYGVHHTADPQWEIGGERHTFWLDAFSSKQQEHILNDQSPHWIHP